MSKHVNGLIDFVKKHPNGNVGIKVGDSWFTWPKPKKDIQKGMQIEFSVKEGTDSLVDFTTVKLGGSTAVKKAYPKAVEGEGVDFKALDAKFNMILDGISQINARLDKMELPFEGDVISSVDEEDLKDLL